MENTIQPFIDKIENYIDVYFATRQGDVYEFDILDVLIKFSIIFSKSSLESWGDYQKNFVAIYEEIAKNKDEEMTAKTYSLFIFNSMMRNTRYFDFMNGLKNHLSEYYNDTNNFKSLSLAFLYVLIKRSDISKVGLSKIMDLAFRFYPIVLDEELFNSYTDFNSRCSAYLEETRKQLVDIYKRLNTDEDTVNEIKEEILLSLDICGEGPTLDKFFLTRGIAAIIAKSIGLNEHEFFLLCCKAFENIQKDDFTTEISEAEHLALIKQEPNHIYLRDGTQLIYDTLKCHYKENSDEIVKINFIMALLLASMHIGNELNEGKYYMIDSASSYYLHAPSIPDIFIALKAFLDVFESSINATKPLPIKEIKSAIIETNIDKKEDLEIQCNTNLFSPRKSDKTLN